MTHFPISAKKNTHGTFVNTETTAIRLVTNSGLPHFVGVQIIKQSYIDVA